MSNSFERQAEDNYEQENDASPVPDDVVDNFYTRGTRGESKNQVPVQSDQQGYDDPVQPPHSNTDDQLADDEREAVDESNILGGDRLRHAKPRSANKYSEGPEEEDLPEDIRHGTSGVSGTKKLS